MLQLAFDWLDNDTVVLILEVNVLGLIFILLKKYRHKALSRMKYIIRKLFKRKSSKTIEDKCKFISENPPDGVNCKVNEPFKKEWTIRNAGNEVWRNRTMVCVTQSVGLEPDKSEFEMPTIFPGEEYTLTVTYVASDEGVFFSNWKMVDETKNIIYECEIGLAVTLKATFD